MTTALANPSTNAKLSMPRDEAVKLLSSRIDEGVRLRKARIWSVGQLDKARELKQAWTLAVTNLLTKLFGGDQEAEAFNRWSGKILPEFASLSQFIERFHDEMDQRLKTLVAVMRRVEAGDQEPQSPTEVTTMAETKQPTEIASQTNLSLVGEQSTEAAAVDALAQNAAVRSGAIILHSRDEAVEESISRFVTMLGYELAVVGKDEVGTKALVQKLAGQEGLEFAVILAGRGESGETAQIGKWDFELGYCVGRLGAGRVCVLHIGGLSVSYDEHGLLHIPVDPAEGWQLQLARHLKRGGIQIDLNRLV